MKKLLIVFTALLMVLGMFGCSKEVKLTEYSNGEIVLQLPEGMEEEFDEGDFEYTISKKDMVIYVSSITKQELAEDYGYTEVSLKDFTEMVINGDEVILRKSFSDHEVFAYTAKIDSEEYYYLISCYETDAKFFIVNFVSFASDRSKFEEPFLDYASKVTFK